MRIYIYLFLLSVGTLGFTQTPVEENFDSDDGGWQAVASAAGTYFEWGTPAGVLINDDNGGGGSAWVTAMDGEFSLTESTEIYLASPAYDLSSLSSSAYLTMAINYDLAFIEDTYYDAVQISYSTDSSYFETLGSLNSGINWYQDNGWIGSSDGWVNTAYELPSELIGASEVYFLIQFYATTDIGGAYGAEGFAMDDFTISTTSVQSEIESMTLAGEVVSAGIDSVARTVTLFLPSGSDVSGLSPTYSLSVGASGTPISGSTQDFSSPVTYTVTAENPNFISEWTVSVKNPVITISLFPDAGAEGSQVSIYGAGFSEVSSENTVTFDGVEAVITSASTNKLEVTVPAGLDVGGAQVVVSTSTMETYPETNFSVLNAQILGTLIEGLDFPIDGVSVINSMAVGDFDQDGDFDFVYDKQSSIVVVLMEAGEMISETTITTDRYHDSFEYANKLYVADVNMDSLPDIVAAGNRVGWFQNMGDGTWSDEVIVLDEGSTYELIIMDADKDFDKDLIISDGDSYLYKNDGEGLFTLASTDVVTTLGIPIDWDLDGDMDIISTGFDYYSGNASINMQMNNGAGTFYDSAIAVTDLFELEKVQLGDLDNDGDLDFIYTASDGFSTSEVGYILNNGDGTFASNTSIAQDSDGVFYTFQLKVADVDGNGYLDVARTMADDIGGVFEMYFGSEGLSFSSADRLDSDISGFDLEFIDIDQDGDLDILQEASTTDGYFPLFRNAVDDRDIVSFSFTEQTGAATINAADSTVAIEVNTTADVTSLIPTISVSQGASVSPASGVAQDFTSSVAYTVTSESGNSREWLVTVEQVPAVPALYADTAYIDQDEALLSWSDISAAETYEVFVGTDSGLSNLLTGYNPVTVSADTSATVSGLSAGTYYYAMVEAFNSAGTGSGSSDTITFLTKPADPVIGQVENDSIGQTSISIYWNQVSGEVTNYDLEVSTSSAFTSLLTDYPYTHADTAFVIGAEGNTAALDANTTYYIRVNANNATGSSGYSNTVTVLTKPATPVISSISNTNINQTTATISWETVFASGGSYNVDLSTTDFTTDDGIITGYPVNVTTTSITLGSDASTTALSTSTNYWARVRSSNDSGESGNSEVVTFLTRPSTPVGSPATNIAESSFTANWTAVSGADGYVLQVSSDNFASTVFNDSLTSNSQLVEGLTGSVQYQYKVNAYNTTGGTAFSSEVLVTTLAPNVAPSGISLDNATIDENMPVGTVVGTISTTDPDDNTHTYSLVAGNGDTGNSHFEINGNDLVTKEVFNFEAESSSNFNVRIQTLDPDGAVYSKSFPITLVNVNDAPTDVIISGLKNPSGYDEVGFVVGTLNAIDEDANNSHTFSLIKGGDAFRISASSLETDVVFTNEVDSVIAITIRAKDGIDSVDVDFDITINAYVDVIDPEVSLIITNPETFLSGGEDLTISATASDFRLSEVKWYKRLLTESEYTSTAVNASNGIYSVNITEEDLGVAGFEYFFEASDEAGNTGFSTKAKMVLEYPPSGQNSPIVESVRTFGRSVESYQILSIPFIFNGNNDRVDVIFDEYGGVPDNRTWRIIRFDNTNNELVNLTASSKIELGQGYFFIAQDEREIRVGEASINLQDPYILKLKAGWNLIGNPYNLDIDWTAVLQKNEATDVVRSLRVLDPQNRETWPESTVLKKFEGAFVQADQDIELEITYADVILTIGGRVAASYEVETPDTDWFLPITLHQNDKMRKGGIGMDQEAKLSLDKFDELVLPGWLQYLEIGFIHENEQFGRYNMDVIPTTDTYVWDFEVASSDHGIARLDWDAATFSGKTLKLLNKSTGQIVDMTQSNSYAFDLSKPSTFQVLYSIDPNAEFAFEKVEMLAIYPNPIAGSFHLPVRIPHEIDIQSMDVQILDLSGKVVWTTSVDHLESGATDIEIRRPESVKTGQYLCKIKMHDSSKTYQFVQKVAFQ